MRSLFSFRRRRPTARTAELLVEEFGEELLVYDRLTNRVHCLSPPARMVWRACDGTISVEQLGPALGLDAEVVARALGELEACELLERGVTRREATAWLAKIGAAAAAGPLIYSIAAPPPALAATAAVCSRVTTAGANPGCGDITGAPGTLFLNACAAAGCVVCGFSGCSGCTGLQGSSGYCMSAACSTSTCTKTRMRAQCCGVSGGAGCTCSNQAGVANCQPTTGCLNA
jgi:hypothetical protein